MTERLSADTVRMIHERIEAEDGRCIHIDKNDGILRHYWECEAEAEQCDGGAPWLPTETVVPSDTFDELLNDGSEDATEKVHRLRDEVLKKPAAKAAYDAQKARIDARVAERQFDGPVRGGE